MCSHPQRATPRCEGEGKRGPSTRTPPRLWTPPRGNRPASSPSDFPDRFSPWEKNYSLLLFER